MNGILFGVGVGPGDPELMTMRAVRTIREADVIAVPQTCSGRSLAYDIARPYIKATSDILPIDMPSDGEDRDALHNAAAKSIMARLAAGCSVVFLALGDISLYSGFSYIQNRIETRGYQVRIIPGVPTACAVAAALLTPLAEGAQPLTIVPELGPDGVQVVMEALCRGQNVAVMKTGSDIAALKSALCNANCLPNAVLIERCGLPGERVVRDLAAFDARNGQHSAVLIKGVIPPGGTAI